MQPERGAVESDIHVAMAATILKWFSRSSSEAKSSTDVGPSENTRLEILAAPEQSDAGGRPADCVSDESEISTLSSSLYPESCSESTEDLNSSTSSSKPIPNEPSQPKLLFPKRNFGSQQRAFCAKWYKQYPWLHYSQEEDSVLCFYCATAVQQKIPLTGYADKTFAQTGFNNWQKALHKFRKHELSRCHRFAVDTITRSSKDVDEMLSTSYAKEKADNRKALYTILSTTRFLARQGLPLRGSYTGHGCGESNSNFMQLLELRKHDVPNLVGWLNRSQDRFTSPTIQNEILEIMASTILRKIAGEVAGEFFSLLVDETTDVSNTEQLVFCIRYVDSQLNSHEVFIGLHSLESTKAQSITRTIGFHCSWKTVGISALMAPVQ